MREHGAMTETRLGALLAILAAAVLLVGCGPTAEAIKPTLDNGDGNGDGQMLQSFGPDDELPNDLETPSGPATPKPAGIATALTSFPASDAFAVSDVVATPGGFVAVGFGGLQGQGYYGLHQGITWHSSDGLNWQENVDPALVDVTPTDVVALGQDVYMIGVYSTCDDLSGDSCEDDTLINVIYKSTAGGPWQELAVPDDIKPVILDDVKNSDGLITARGSAADDEATTTVWTSSDGTNWTTTTNLAGLDPVDSLTWLGDKLVAFGGLWNDASGTLKLAVATAADKVSFARANVPEIESATVYGLGTGPTGTVGVGAVEPADGPATGMTLFSSDGVNWSQTSASDGSFAGSQLWDAHANGSGFVAVGATIADDEQGTQTSRVWVTADGQTWKSAGEFGGSFDQYGASAFGPQGLVVFTMDQKDSEANGGYDLISTVNGWLIPPDGLTP